MPARSANAWRDIWTRPHSRSTGAAAVCAVGGDGVGDCADGTAIAAASSGAAVGGGCDESGGTIGGGGGDKGDDAEPCGNTAA